MVRRTAQAMNNVLKQRTWGLNAKKAGYAAVVGALNKLGSYAASGATKYVGKRMAALNRQSYKKYRGPKRCRGTKRKSSTQLSKTIKKVIRTEEARDRPVGIYKRVTASAYEMAGYVAKIEAFESPLGNLLGLLPTDVLKAAAICFNSAVDSGVALSNRTGNFTEAEKIECLKFYVNLNFKNNSNCGVTVHMYVGTPKTDTNVAFLTDYKDRVSGSLVQFNGIGGAQDNFLYDPKDFPSSLTDMYTYTVVKFRLEPGGQAYRTIGTKPMIYRDADHKIGTDVTNHWGRSTKNILYRFIPDLIINGDGGRNATRWHDEATATGPPPLGYGKVIVEETKIIKILKPESSTALSNSVIYSNFSNNDAGLLERTPAVTTKVQP